MILFLLCSIVNCKEDKAEDRAHIHGLPVGYTGIEDKVMPAIKERSKNHVYVEEPRAKESIEISENVYSIDQNVKLRSWRSQPKKFVHTLD